MGAYHFFLPFMFRWSAFITKIPKVIQWALFSINFFFSFLLLAGGILTFVALRRFTRSLAPDRGLLLSMTAFWIANTLYQLFIPMPLPSKLWLLHVILLGYGVVAALAYLIGVAALRNGVIKH